MTPSQKSDSDNPKWYMVDLTFSSRAKKFVPLALLKFVADLPSNSAPEEIDYLGEEGVKAIKGRHSSVEGVCLLLTTLHRNGSGDSR